MSHCIRLNETSTQRRKGSMKQHAANRWINGSDSRKPCINHSVCRNQWIDGSPCQWNETQCINESQNPSWSTQSTVGAIKLWIRINGPIDQFEAMEQFMNRCIQESLHQSIHEPTQCQRTYVSSNTRLNAPVYQNQLCKSPKRHCTIVSASMHQCIHEADSMYQWIINELLLHWVMETNPPTVVGGWWPSGFLATVVGGPVWWSQD